MRWRTGAALGALFVSLSVTSAGAPRPDWSLDDAARERFPTGGRTWTRERICLNGIWLCHLGDRAIGPVTDERTLALLERSRQVKVFGDFEEGVRGWYSSADPKETAVKLSSARRKGAGAMHLAFDTPKKGYWTVGTNFERLPEEGDAVSLWMRARDGSPRIRLRLLERKEGGLEIYCTPVFTVEWNDWRKVAVSVDEFAYFWGSGKRNDKRFQRENVNAFEVSVEPKQRGAVEIDHARLEETPPELEPAIPAGDWATTKVPGRIFPKEFTITLPDGRRYAENETRLPTTGWYGREFACPAGWKGGRVLLDVGRVNERGRLYLNGRLVGRGPGLVDITDLVKVGRSNRLDIYASNTRTGKQWWQQMRWTAGIYGDVWLECRRSRVNVASVRIITSVKNGAISADVRVENTSPRPFKGKLAAEVRPWPEGAAEKGLPPVSIEVQAGSETEARLKAGWADPKLWSPETPQLYVLVTRLMDAGGRGVDEQHERFGFREVSRSGRDFTLNGKILRLRGETSGVPACLYTGRCREFIHEYLRFLKAMNYNMIGFGIGSSLGAKDWADACDEIGVVWIPGWGAWSKWAYEMVKNNPSIIAWSGDSWYTMHPWRTCPAVLGTDYFPSWLEGKRGDLAQRAAEAKKLDPTRLMFHYGCGNVGDCWHCLPYLCFGIPLQEREDWPKRWAEQGTMPIYCAEFDFPFMFSFLDIDAHDRGTYSWNEGRKKSLHLENAARYFGDEAFSMSRRLLLHHFNSRDEGGNVGRACLEINRLWVKHTLRSWRGYGLSALGLFGLATGGYGHVVTDLAGGESPAPPAGSPKTAGPKPDRIAGTVPMDEPTIVYDVVKESLEPLLVYIGGAPEFTAKDHAFFAGEPIRKQIVAVNDRLRPAAVEVEWKLVDPSGRGHAKGTERIDLGPGQIEFVPFEVRAPQVAAKRSFRLTLSASEDGESFATDEFAVQVFPKPSRSEAKARVAVFDGEGSAQAILKRAGMRFKKLSRLEGLSKFDLLVIGRRSLDPDLDFAALQDAVLAGLQVLCLEQSPEGALGGLLDQTCERYTFARWPGHPLLEGLDPEDLVNWRGSSDLIAAYPEPAAESERSYPEEFWHWGNKGIVATCVIKKPHVGAYRPVLSCGYDLEYTPLLEVLAGRGRIVFCQLDVSNRYGTDPVATKLVDNTLSYLQEKLTAPRRAVYLGGRAGRQVLELVGIEARSADPARLRADEVLIVGEPEGAMPADAIARFVEEGGTVFSLAKAADQFGWLPFDVEAEGKKIGRTIFRGPPAFLAGLGESDFYWRMEYDIIALTGLPQRRELAPTGVVARVPYGAGQYVFCQVDPLLFRRVRDTVDRAATTAFQKTLRILTVMLLNTGVRSSEPLALRPVKTGVKWEALVEEDFEDGEAGGWRAVSGKWDIAGGVLRMKPGRGSDEMGGRNLFLCDAKLRDFRLEADIRADFPAGGHLLIYLDYQTPKDYYFIQLSKKGFFFANIRDGRWGKTVAGPDDPLLAVNDDRTHSFRVEMVGTECKFVFDDRLVFHKTGLLRKERIEHAVAEANGRVGFGSYWPAITVDDVRISIPGARTAEQVVPGRHVQLDISKACNVPLVDEVAGDGRGGWFDSGDADLRELPRGDQVFAGVPFRILDEKKTGEKACIVLYGKRLPGMPRRVTVDVAGPLGLKRARTIYVLHGCGYAGSHLATYEIVYSDGTRHGLPIVNNETVGDWYAPFGQHNLGGAADRLDPKVCALAWEGPTPKFTSAGLYCLAWPNPHPEKAIRRLELSSPGVEQGHVGIVAITLSDAPARMLPVRRKGAAAAERPRAAFSPSFLFRYVADRWNYNVDRFREW